MTPELQILCWAASRTLPIPRVAVINEKELLRLLLLHRLTHRLVARLDAEPSRPPWCGGLLMARLRFDRREIERLSQEQLKAAREIMAAETGDALPPLFLKGFMTHALLNKRHVRHFSGDLDILPWDCDALFQRLGQNGFTGVLNPPGRHTYASLERGEVGIDLHRWFPAFSTPMVVGDDALHPERHPGIWFQETTDCPFKLLTCIRYEDIRDEAMRGQTPETEDLWFPDPAMAALLLCSHEMKNIGDFPERTLRLGELADINDLARCRHFSADRFHQYTKRFDMQDAVAAIAGLCRRLLAECCLPIITEPVEGLAPTKRWASFGFSSEDLLDFPNLEKTVDSLGANSIKMGQVYGTTASPTVLPLERLILRSRRDNVPEIQLSIQEDNSDLLFSLVIGPALSESGLEYTLYLLVGDYDCGPRSRSRFDYYITANNCTSPPFILAQATSLATENGYKVQVRYTWGAGRTELIPVLLFLVRWDSRKIKALPDGEPAGTEWGSSLVIPLNIELPDPASGDVSF